MSSMSSANMSLLIPKGSKRISNSNRKRSEAACGGLVRRGRGGPLLFAGHHAVSARGPLAGVHLCARDDLAPDHRGEPNRHSAQDRPGDPDVHGDHGQGQAFPSSSPLTQHTSVSLALQSDALATG